MLDGSLARLANFPRLADDSRRRWLALLVLCAGDLMIVLDVTIVNVALPSIKADLGFSEATLAWVVNAYLLTFGGCLLLAGRAGDLFGPRKVFIGGIALFTGASLACGLANSEGLLIAARTIQGIGGATVAAVALALIMRLFTEPGDRAKAMGVFGFVASGGGSVGVVAGGFLTDALDWHWIFLVNIPIGVAVFLLSLRLLPGAHEHRHEGPVDIAGAVTVTGALMLAVYAILHGETGGWASGETIGLLLAAVALLGVFVAIELRTKAPLVPMGLFRHRNIAGANGVSVFMAAAMFGWFFMSSLYLQNVLGYDSREVGLAFLPGTLLMGALSLGVSAKIVMRFGIRGPLATGLGFFVLGLVLFARAPAHGNYVRDVLPGMILLGLGGAISFNPLLLAAMSDVGPAEAGLASGIVNTSQMMGGALGLAVLASLAASRTNSLERGGDAVATALNGGYHLAFAIGAGFALAALAIAVAVIRAAVPSMAHGEMPSESELSATT
jgi:EmrB/QacA subfamily drug resistance transporter